MNTKLSSIIPQPPTSMFLESQDFLIEDFKVELLISKCKLQGASLESLRESLDRFFKHLKERLVEIVYDDYYQFIQISQNLSSFDGNVKKLQQQVNAFENNLDVHKTSVNDVLFSVQKVLYNLEYIDRKKILLNKLICIHKILFILEPDNQKFQLKYLSENEYLEKSIRDVYTLKGLLSINIPCKSVQDTCISRITDFEEHILSKLTNRFIISLQASPQSATDIEVYLRMYSKAGKQQLAEEVHRSSFVKQNLQDVICKSYLSQNGLASIYGQIIDFILVENSIILSFTSESFENLETFLEDKNSNDYLFNRAFNFVGNSILAEVIHLFNQNLSDIFLVTDRSSFHLDFSITLIFINQIKDKCITTDKKVSEDIIKQCSEFLDKWNSSVYFQVCFKEISTKFELSLVDTPTKIQFNVDELSPKTFEQNFKISVFGNLCECVSMCWDYQCIFIPILAHLFLKLTLQLISRTTYWLKMQFDYRTCDLQLMVLILHDIDLFICILPNYWLSLIEYSLSHFDIRDESVCNAAITKAFSNCNELVKKPRIEIIHRLQVSAAYPLETAYTIPRIYRKTNKDTPDKCSSYINTVFHPLSQFEISFTSTLKQNYIDIIMRSVCESITERFTIITNEVYTSVKKTEDSLLRRKKRTNVGCGDNSSTQTEQSAQYLNQNKISMNDDNKIRLQLALDIDQFLIETAKLTKIENSTIYSNLKQFSMLLREEIDASSKIV